MEKISRHHKIPIIDIQSRGWGRKISENPDAIILCDKKSLLLAKRQLDSTSQERLRSLDGYTFGLEEETEKSSETFKVGECVLSKRANKNTDKAKAWVTPQQVKLFHHLLNKDLKLEILDDLGNPIQEVNNG